MIAPQLNWRRDAAPILPRLAPGLLVAIAVLVASFLLWPRIGLLPRLGLAIGGGLAAGQPAAAVRPLAPPNAARGLGDGAGPFRSRGGDPRHGIGQRLHPGKTGGCAARASSRGRPLAGRVPRRDAGRRAQLDRARGRASRLARIGRDGPQAAEPLLSPSRRRPPTKRRSIPAGTASFTRCSASRTSRGAGSCACGGSRS